jgi:hypothetical protein
MGYANGIKTLLLPEYHPLIQSLNISGHENSTKGNGEYDIFSLGLISTAKFREVF